MQYPIFIVPHVQSVGKMLSQMTAVKSVAHSPIPSVETRQRNGKVPILSAATAFLMSDILNYSNFLTIPGEQGTE